ncbi:MAG: hypothetical protein HGB17_10060, partial [Syntrophobacteraceae bacterium]|nr:hypothetical protein [Syntrophobacteraceae bacterium]
MTRHTIPVHRTAFRFVVLGIVFCLLLLFPASGIMEETRDPGPGNATQEQIQTALGNLSLFFVPNEGQTDPAVLFTCKGQGFTQFYTRDRVVTSFPYDDSGARTAVFQWFSGGNPEPVAEGLDPLETKVSYFTGDVSEWHTNITPFGAVVYRDVYPGIDVICRGDRGMIKREYLVRPGADPYRIRLGYKGAQQVRVSGEGYLVVKAGTGEIRESPPLCYQVIEGKRVEVPCRFDQADDGSISFFTGWYDRSLPLMIDPALVYCGYIGGASVDEGNSIAVDGAGNAYVTGYTLSDQTTFPDTSGPDPTYNGGQDAFVAKVNAGGIGLSYCGYIGGSGQDGGSAIAVDAAGNAYITGYTESDQTTFPE